MKIRIAIQCYNFEHRLCWMLSSIHQQYGIVPNLEVDVAYVKDAGSPTCESVLDYFKDKGVSIIKREYKTMSDIQFRGITRNHQLQDCDADYILFADSDHVYPHDYFFRIHDLLIKPAYSKIDKLMYAGRKSTKLKPTQVMIDKYTYPYEIANAFEEASKLEGMNMSLTPAGNCHLVKIDAVKRLNDNYYVKPELCKDFSWETRYACARSDIQFRRVMGFHKLTLPRVIHLQHVRSRDNTDNLQVQK